MKPYVSCVMVFFMMVLHVLPARWPIMKNFAINAQDFHGLERFVRTVHLLQQRHSVVIALIMVYSMEYVLYVH